LIPPFNPAHTEPIPSILIFITHHRPHLAEKDMAFLSSLAESGTGWTYERVMEEWTGPMFDSDPGEERVRGTVHGFRAWRVAKTHLGSAVVDA
jgi:nicotinamide N-methyltransferase